MNDVSDIGLGLDVSYICRYCKWEQAQNDIIERMISKWYQEKLGIKLTEESAEKNDRLDRMEENNRRLVELINEIDTQTWPTLDRTTIAIAVVPKLKVSKIILGLL